MTDKDQRCARCNNLIWLTKKSYRIVTITTYSIASEQMRNTFTLCDVCGQQFADKFQVFLLEIMAGREIKYEH